MSATSAPTPGPGHPVVVRPLQPQDLERAAARQRRELPDGFFSRLGQRFVVRYLQTFLDGPAAVALTVELHGDPVGHLVGTVGAGHYRWVLRARLRSLLPVGVLALLVRPATAWRFARTRLGRYTRAALAAARHRPATRGSATPRAPDAAGGGPGPAALLHVAVDPEARGAGAGAALVAAFEAQARAAGCRAARLVTFDSDAGPDAAAFYRRLGWQLTGSRTDDDGRRVLTCTKTL